MIRKQVIASKYFRKNKQSKFEKTTQKQTKLHNKEHKSVEKAEDLNKKKP